MTQQQRDSWRQDILQLIRDFVPGCHQVADAPAMDPRAVCSETNQADFADRIRHTDAGRTGHAIPLVFPAGAQVGREDQRNGHIQSASKLVHLG